MNWGKWGENNAVKDAVPTALHHVEFEWEETDERAAWALYIELRTRIATQDLPSHAGDERSSLKSIHELFPRSRAILVEHGAECRRFSWLVTEFLNEHVRPFTAYWHGRLEDQALISLDQRRKFRAGLRRLQLSTRAFTAMLAVLVGDAIPQGRTTAAPPRPLTPIPLDKVREGLKHLPSELAGKELAAVAARRQEVGLTQTSLNHLRVGGGGGGGLDERDSALVGLALSGGGIRSATFGLGVLQGLQRTLQSGTKEATISFLQRVDYLSTVSGGGYLGAWLTSHIGAAKDKYDAKANPLDPKNIGTDVESPAVRRLRHNSKYLATGSLTANLSAALVIAAGACLHLLSLVPIVFVMTSIALTAWGPVDDVKPRETTDPAGMTSVWVMLRWLFATSAILFVIYLLVRRVHRGRVMRVLGWLAGGAAALALLGGAVAVANSILPALLAVTTVCALVGTRVHVAMRTALALFGLVPAMALVAAATAAFKYLSDPSLKLPGGWTGWYLVAILIVLAGVARSARGAIRRNAGEMAGEKVYGILVCSLWFAIVAVAALAVVRSESTEAYKYAAIASFALTALMTLFYDLNVTSPHSFYRDSLARAYVEGAPEARIPISKINASELAPYHLINTAVNLPGSDDRDLFGRRSEIYCLTRHSCGSRVTNYLPTEDFERRNPDVDLATAMAISGAAASAHMGTLTLRSAIPFLTLLNVRMGYYVARSGAFPLWRLLGPGLAFLLKEATSALDEHDAFLNLSDGGHIENLGVYELLRRRCQLIIAVDGECDPAVRSGSLIQLMRMAEIDLGILVHIDLTDVRASPTGLSGSHFALGTIDYPGAHQGYLVYIKSSVTGDESPVVGRYREAHRSFPHETTADQFFDEEQFEAYRALGAHIGTDVGQFGSRDETGRIPIEVWFQRLRDSLPPDADG